ncbi:MAG: hypothetical protein ACR652_25480 [Methylocystis sp.]|uniref:hypothetical protein n=1 Tax=Methylocystis sp. TaxID=1911079 RepID=UPI003DA1ED0C
MTTPHNPPEFNQLTAFFLQYADEIYASVEEMIDDGWRSLTPTQQRSARAFLDQIQSGDYSETELREIWRASKAALQPMRGRRSNCRKLFEVMRARHEVIKDPVAPQQFEAFCACFDIALNADAQGVPKAVRGADLDRAIEYGLSWCARDDLVILRDFLSSVMERPDAAEQLSKLMKRAHPGTDSHSGPGAPPDEPAVVQALPRVLTIIEQRLA